MALHGAADGVEAFVIDVRRRGRGPRRVPAKRGRMGLRREIAAGVIRGLGLAGL